MTFKFRPLSKVAFCVALVGVFALAGCADPDAPGPEAPAPESSSENVETPAPDDSETEAPEAETPEAEAPDSDVPETPPAPETEVEPGVPVGDTPETSEDDPTYKPEATVSFICDDETFTNAAEIPAALEEAEAPFYACVNEMAAITGTDPLFVGEYDSTHESIIIEMNITEQFDNSNWVIDDRTVEGDNAVTMAHKPGYSLVVAIGPSRTEGALSSLHYTLRTE